MIEIMAPAGNYESLAAAIKAGANSVYFGVEQLNMRARAANNFKLDDLSKIISICKRSNTKTYLTVNTIMYDHDLNLMKNICDEAKRNEVTAVICSDMAAINYANSIGLEVHISTQTNISNIEAVKFYSKFADVIVLARELTLQQIQFICDEVKKQNIKGPKGDLIEIEIFAHGALCVAISGKCYMSLATDNASANRGACIQNCRKRYRVIDDEEGKELVLENEYIMSPKDLSTIGFLDKIIPTGVKVLKLEGRGRSIDYVYKVVKCYREAVDSFIEGSYSKEKIENWNKELGSVYNRGFWEGGYYLGKQLGEWSGAYGSQSQFEKKFIGTGRHYFSNKKIGEFKLEAGELKKGDKIMITGNTTGFIECKVEELYVNGKPSEKAVKGDLITIPVERIREKDKLFVLDKR